MKITIEPTGERPASFEARHHTVSIADENDDLTGPDVVWLVRQALIAWGFAEQTIVDAMREVE